MGDADEQGSQGRRLNIGKYGNQRAAWSASELIHCTDGKSRRVEPGTFPLVARLSSGMVPSGDPSVSYAQATAESRVARLRGYGNSIIPQLAAEFIRASLEAIHENMY
jgi:DNA (cytosine-5)-methyltransferase 1